jgi:site-specific DNA-methyltransferase (adenine-specific)
MIDLRLGPWQEALADVVECDAVICDPPYSERTHKGALSVTGEVGVDAYPWLEPEDAAELARWWCERSRGWVVFHTDDVLFPVFRAAMEAAGRYCFPQVPVLQQQPRVTGDGPAAFGHLLAVSRPRARKWLEWGSLPGWYEAPREKGQIRGAKPIGLMQAIVRDYSRPGDLVVDPFAGSGTTALACAIEGRRCITSEKDPKHYAIAKKRLNRGYTPAMFV